MKCFVVEYGTNTIENHWFWHKIVLCGENQRIIEEDIRTAFNPEMVRIGTITVLPLRPGRVSLAGRRWNPGMVALGKGFIHAQGYNGKIVKIERKMPEKFLRCHTGGSPITFIDVDFGGEN